MRKVVYPIVAVILVAVAVSLFTSFGGLKWFGKGGDGEGTGTGIPANESSVSESNSTEIASVLEIKVEEDKIYFDGERCTDENDLKDRITEIGTEKEYIFVYDNAIKATYDKVQTVLSELEDVLGIEVHDG